MGIKDFKPKEAMVFELLNVRAPRQLVMRVNKQARLGYTEAQIKKTADAWRHWDTSSPQTIEHLDFLQALIGCFPIEAISLTVNSFIDKPYREIYKVISADYRVMLDPPAEGLGDLERAISQYRPYWGTRREIKDIDKSIREDSYIDQRHIYLSNSSAANWYAFLHDKDYRQYRECVDSLHALLGSAKWLELSENIDGAVMLGAGTESKDRIIVDHLQQRSQDNKHVNYYIVDFSYDMLMPTVLGLDLHISEKAPRVRLQRPIVADFCKLSGDFRLSDVERLAWFLPGGTLGNLQEDEFFASMSNVLRVGDLLVVGVEIIDGDISKFKQRLRKKYNTPVFRRFVSAPIRAHWPMNLDLRKALRDTKIDIVQGSADDKHLRDHSRVPRALSVAVSVPIGRKRATLLFSTRYELDELLKFATADRFGFTLVHEEFRRETPSYRQLVFRRDERGDGRGESRQMNEA